MARGFLLAAVLTASGLINAASAEPAPPAETSAGKPSILILGSDHFMHANPPYPEKAVSRVVDAMKSYGPDMVVAEYLPPTWPKGKGRDYRPGFDLGRYATRWGIEKSQARRELARIRRTNDWSAKSDCRLGKLFFLQRDELNALYYWVGRDCEATSHGKLAKFVKKWSQHEFARIGFPVARADGIHELVSFDYQGSDARWILDKEMQKAKKSGNKAAYAQFAPLRQLRKWADKRMAALGHRLIPVLDFFNSKEWVQYKRHFYQKDMSTITYDNAGPRQRKNFWLRNRRMFGYISKAVRARHPKRILVIVGAGHKYFLDKLARQAGYHWVDPLDYLPRAH